MSVTVYQKELRQQEEPVLYRELPEVFKVYKQDLDGNDASSQAVKEVVELFAFFLTQPAHTAERVSALAEKKVILIPSNGMRYPSESQAEQFKQWLATGIKLGLRLPQTDYSIAWNTNGGINHPNAALARSEILSFVPEYGICHFFPQNLQTELTWNPNKDTVSLKIFLAEEE